MAIPQLRVGDMVANTYRIDKKLGEGGFGGVYLVTDMKRNEPLALKVEGATDEVQVLKMEVMVLDTLRKVGGRHFCTIEDRGRNDAYNWIVMTLVGQSLADLRKACPQGKFSLGTALGVGIQCLEAVEDMHRIGFLHRDLKPGNFAVANKDVRKVIILDFGMCRKYLKPDGQIRTPRRAAGFRGTIKYAPMACHLSKELARKDDIESWLYQQVEITSGQLPWTNCTTMEQVGDSKRQCIQAGGGQLMLGCPREYTDILLHVCALKYFDAPDYNMLYNKLRAPYPRYNIRETDAYDWEPKGQHYGRTQMMPPPVYNPHADAGGFHNFA